MNGIQLVEMYKAIAASLGAADDESKSSVNQNIKEILHKFMDSHKRVAIYCFGYHTKMLMTDFISDIRDVVCIVDRNYKNAKPGFTVISDGELETYEIDGVIISSYRYREEIKASMAENHPTIDFLDIYDELSKVNILLSEEYYSTGPYQVYTLINGINNVIAVDDSCKLDKMRELLKIYVSIKDFRLAIEVSEAISEMTHSKEDEEMLHHLRDIYYAQIAAIKQSAKRNVILLCLDGMRYSDFDSEKLKKTREALGKKGKIYQRAYSYSTMTFESLVPAFSGNTDQKTRYFINDEVEASECRFCKEAMDQGRSIYIYGDGYKYIDSDKIQYAGRPQTISEKIWSLTIDICDTDNGLFYLHELYETHYSYPNPYTKGHIVACGTAMLFDYLGKNGGRLQTDYVKQLSDSLEYIDDTLTPFISAFPCSLLMFADHGNLLLEKDTVYSDIRSIQLTASEDWIRIPWVVVSPEIVPGEDDSLVSLLDINDVVISLLDGKDYCPDKERKYIKIGRSEIYNPEFKEVYKLIDSEYNGEAFEGFVFADGFKLIVYSNGRKEIYSIKDDEIIHDEELLRERLDMVSQDISIL